MLSNGMECARRRNRSRIRLPSARYLLLAGPIDLFAPSSGHAGIEPEGAAEHRRVTAASRVVQHRLEHRATGVASEPDGLAAPDGVAGTQRWPQASRP